MTGTPLDMTPFGSIVNGIGWLYWLLALGLLVLAVRRPKTLLRKALWSLLVVAMFGAMPAIEIRDAYAAQARLKASLAHFEMRCKGAGEKISRTVPDVEGVVWMKWRKKHSAEDEHDQYKLTDPYGPSCSEGDCLKLLLRATLGLDIDPGKRMPFYRGYAFVEALDPTDGGRYRYVLRLRSGNLDHQELEKKSIQAWSARYGITWDDISTREDRAHWIAGSSLKVVDLQTNEVLAERIGYMMDPGQGSRSGFRTPWLMAERTACPAFDISESGNPSRWSRSQGFVFRVLQPSKDR